MTNTVYREQPDRAAAQVRYSPQTDPDPAAIRATVDILMRAERPIIYGGGGLINSGPRASELLTELVEMTGWPTTLTLMGLGALSAMTRVSSACLACTAPTRRTLPCTGATPC